MVGFTAGTLDPIYTVHHTKEHPMKQLAILLPLAIAAASAAYAASPLSTALDAAKIGELPAGWSAAHTGDGTGSDWKVLEDATAPGGKRVLAQTSAKGRGRFFNLCVADASSYADIDMSVSFKAVAGRFDQGGGLVWRYKDANNYYIARMNPLEDNFRVYKVLRGTRIQLGTADVKIPMAQWHAQRVVQRGNHIECYLDGKLLLDVKDDTFTKAGKIGLWTKADARTYFADLQVK
jgi:hypothetical protein